MVFVPTRLVVGADSLSPNAKLWTVSFLIRTPRRCPVLLLTPYGVEGLCDEVFMG